MAESIRLLNEYLGLYPTDIDGWRELGEWYLEAGHVEAAKTALEECVMLAPINYVTHTMLADTLYTLGDFATARKYYAQSLELNGSKTNARAALGMVLCTTAINSKRNSTADEKVCSNSSLHSLLVPSSPNPPPSSALFLSPPHFLGFASQAIVLRSLVIPCGGFFARACRLLTHCLNCS